MTLTLAEEMVAFRKFLALKGQMADEFSSCVCGHFDDCPHARYYDEVAELMLKWEGLPPGKRRAWLSYEVSGNAKTLMDRVAARLGEASR